MKDPIERLLARLDRQVKRSLDEIGMVNNTANKARLDEISGEIEGVRRETLEVRRIVTDDLDASTETAALLGRTLASLTASVESLRTEVAELRAHLDRSPGR